MQLACFDHKLKANQEDGTRHRFQLLWIRVAEVTFLYSWQDKGKG